MRLLTVAVVCATLPALALAQPAVPKRPKLKAGADTNDWVAYYERGVGLIKEYPDQAADAFYWAGRLNPAVAEPQYARGVALWRSNHETLLAAARGSEEARRKGAAMDSLLVSGLRRNPLVDQRLTLLKYERIPNLRWRDDSWTQGAIAYGNSRYEDAVRYYGRALESKAGPKDAILYDRALAYLALKQYDSALADLSRLAETLERNDRTYLARAFESKAMLYYAIGSIQLLRNDYGAAREAFEHALTEDLSLYTVHLALGEVARLESDIEGALREYAQAVELEPRDANARFVYGTALFQAGQYKPAVEQLRAAAELEPYWALPYVNLGFALEKDGDGAGAAAAYAQFLARAPRTGLERQVDYARRRLGTPAK
jgi:tetratricopeptide (TPR) repeat protein